MGTEEFLQPGTGWNPEFQWDTKGISIPSEEGKGKKPVAALGHLPDGRKLRTFLCQASIFSENGEGSPWRVGGRGREWNGLI
jgi:hypothetical protein